jgi:APA family basic amino acid/polyamine antiporter
MLRTDSDRALVRAIGVLGLAAGIFNTTVGGGIFRLPAAVSGMIGAAAPIVYLVCAVTMGLIVLCFAEAGSRVSRTGGPYAYVAVVFGPYAGFMAGVLLWLLGTTAVASVASACAGFVGAFVPALSSPMARAMVLASVFAVMTAVNVTGVKQGSRLITVLAAAKLLPLLVLVGAGVAAITPSNLAISVFPSASSVARTAIVLIFAFTGVESALVPSGEMRNPSRSVPWAIAIAMTGITVLYLAIQTVAQGVLGPALADAKAAPLALVAEHLMGAPGRTLLLCGAIVSTLGYLSGMTLAVPRALFALACDGFLPKAVANVHPRFLTPHVAIVVQSVLVCALAIGNEFEALAVLANLSALLLYLACAVAGYLLKRRGIQDGGAKPFSLPGGPTVHILACAMIVWLLTSITRDEWTKVGLTLAVATVIFAVTRWSGARRQRA